MSADTLHTSFNAATRTIKQLLSELCAANSEACASNNQLLHLHLLDLIGETNRVVARMKHINAILNEESRG